MKDWYLICKYCRSLLLISAVFMAASVFIRNSTFFFIYPAVLMGTVPVTLCSVDEREKWTRFGAALPVSREMYVSEKYLVGLLCLAAVLAPELLIQAAAGQGAGALPDMAATVCASMLFPASLVLPFIFRFGVEKGRILFGAVLLCLLAGIMALNGSGLLFPAADALPSDSPVPLILLCAMGALYALSWLCSTALYRKKEL